MKRLHVLVVAVAIVAAVPAQASSPPRKEIVALKRQVAALKAQLTTAQKSRKMLAGANERLLRENDALRGRVAAVDPCPITKPNGVAPAGAQGSTFHGTTSFAVALWGHGVIVGEPQAGTGSPGVIGAKVGWWRGVRGELTVEGRRLDAPAAPLGAHIPDGYAESGFQPTGLLFPTEGCWEVTGRVGGASLTFVTLVLRA